MKKKISHNRKYRRKPNFPVPLRKVLRNPSDDNDEKIKAYDIVRNETKEFILNYLEAIENQFNNSGLILEYGTVSLLRRQFARGDIDRDILFYWLRREGLLEAT